MPSDVRFRDRSTRLTVFGILSICLGAMCGFFALLMPLSLLLARRLHEMNPGPAPPEQDPRGVVVSILFCLAMLAMFVWLGIGSIQARRWVRPLMLIVAWTWLITGVLSLVGTMIVFEDAMLAGMAQTPGRRPPPQVVAVIKTVMLLVLTGIYVVVPAVLIWAYTGRDVRLTCEARHPTPGWTDRCPISVLALSVGLGAGALSLLAAMLYPAFPFFGLIVTGGRGVVLILLLAVLLAWLARETYRMTAAGWWGSTLLFVAFGVSSTLTFLRHDTIAFYEALGYPEQQLAVVRQISVINSITFIAFSDAMAILGVVYMLYVRRHFRRPPDAGDVQ